MPPSSDAKILSLDAWRRDFSTLFDRTACAVRALGYDLDDVVLDRLLVCRLPSGGQVRVAAEPLSNAVLLTKAIGQACGVAPGDLDDLVIGLEVRVLVER